MTYHIYATMVGLFSFGVVVGVLFGHIGEAFNKRYVKRRIAKLDETQ